MTMAKKMHKLNASSSGKLKVGLKKGTGKPEGKMVPKPKAGKK